MGGYIGKRRREKRRKSRDADENEPKEDAEEDSRRWQRERERERRRRRSEVEEKKSRWTDRGTGPARVAESGHNPNAIVYSTIMLPCMFIKTKQE